MWLCNLYTHICTPFYIWDNVGRIRIHKTLIMELASWAQRLGIGVWDDNTFSVSVCLSVSVSVSLRICLSVCLCLPVCLTMSETSSQSGSYYSHWPRLPLNRQTTSFMSVFPALVLHPCGAAVPCSGSLGVCSLLGGLRT